MRPTQKTQSASPRRLTQPRTIAASDHGGQSPKNIPNAESQSEACACQLSKSRNTNNVARQFESAAAGNSMHSAKKREYWHCDGDCCLPHSPGQIGEESDSDVSKPGDDAARGKSRRGPYRVDSASAASSAFRKSVSAALKLSASLNLLFALPKRSVSSTADFRTIDFSGNRLSTLYGIVIDCS